jgi:serine palmitoyltransferase
MGMKAEAASSSRASVSTADQPLEKQHEWKRHKPEDVPDVSFAVAILVYFNYFFLAVIGHIRDMVAKFTGISRFELNKHCRKGYCNLFNAQESFYVRRVYGRLQDCWNRPLTSGPGVYVDIMTRKIDPRFEKNSMGVQFKRSTESVRCMNLGSYNYLGFADDWKETCRDEVVQSVDRFPNSMTSSPLDFGTTSIHKHLEDVVARFVGKESAVVFPMGFNTNAATVPCLMGRFVK